MDFAPLLESALSMRAEHLTDWTTIMSLRDALKHVRLDLMLERSE